MGDLIKDPAWQADQLGTPIPDSPHAVSACLPTWADNIGYEEQELRVVEKLTTGYPRFVYNRFCRQLFEECESRFANDEQASRAFPSLPAAERFATYMKNQTAQPAKIDALGINNVHAVSFLKQFSDIAKNGWQHCGEGVSSRLAEACLMNRIIENAVEEKWIIRHRVAVAAGVADEDVFLFPSGMAAFYALYRTINHLFPYRKSVQFGFPYVDSLKIQEKFGQGVHFYPRGNEEELRQLQKVLQKQPISGLYTEFPSNPLLTSPNLKQLSDLARQYKFPLILDDTIATFINAQLLSVADVICSSLTKFFSGAGDVTAGSLVLNANSPFYRQIASRLNEEEDNLWSEDAIVLEHNSRDFEKRVRKINKTAEQLADFLRKNPKVADVYYPKFQTQDFYHEYLKSDGGYGGLLSIILENASETAPRFYDALRICKGPNLGTNYSLVCPFTILAHYNELDFAESCGVSRYLIRVSVGLEQPDDLISRFEEALSII